MTERKLPSVETVHDNSIQVTDSLGRRIVYRPMGAKEKGWFVRAMGVHASNAVAFGYSGIAAGVRSIDGTPTMFPRDLEEIDDLTDWVADEGYAAVTTEIEKRDAKSVEDVKAAAKNSPTNQK